MSQNHVLSLEQQQAAFTFDAPICILAGAGSGKTRVITKRIAHLIKEHGVSPFNILGVTFTNKAAKEMRERVQNLLSEIGRDVLLGTFHGLSARFLRYYGHFVAVNRDFLIYDEDDAARLIKKIIKERYDLSKDELNLETKKVMRFREKEKTISDNDALVSSERATLILEAYQERLQKIGALDFSSLLKKFLELLESDQGRYFVCDRVQHLLVDEYQDINAIQAEIVHILAKNAQSVAIVGDDDQQIYGWRGASAHFMQTFLAHFKSAKLFRLEDNYRSTKPILDCANAIIANNSQRLGKNLRSMNGDGPPIRLSRHFRDIQEAGFVVEQSMRLFEQYGSNFEVAVLMRTNAQSRPLEEALHKARMPYRMVGGMRFYDRKEIKDILCALRTIVYPQSDVDFIRLLNALPFGIGKKTQDAIAKYAGLYGLSFFEVISDEEHQKKALGNSRSQKRIAKLLNLLSQMRAELITDSGGEEKIIRADEALIYVIDKFGFISRLEQKADDEAQARLENIEQLVQAAVLFVEEAESYKEAFDAQSFLENVALISKDESVQDESQSGIGTITLMTLHAAKGLEFDCVFLVGLEEGVLPHTRSLHGFDEEKRKSALEEERRLLYVGMTRAKKRLLLSFCQERFLHGKTAPQAPSRFLKEVLSATIHESDRWILDQLSAFKHLNEEGQILFLNPTKAVVNNFEQKQGLPIEYHYNLEPNNIFEQGERVYHKGYQLGSIISLSGSGRMMRAKVRFDCDDQIRTIMATHLKKSHQEE